MARGRAWGNALGGYRRQRRDSKGRFAGGKTGASISNAKKRAKKSPAKKKRTSSRSKAQTTLQTASKRPYNKAALNKQLQRNHRATIAGSYVGVYGGSTAGALIGGAAAGAPGAMIGRQMGMVVGQVAAQTALQRSGRLVTDKDFAKAGKDDQAAMARRIKHAQRGHIVIQGAQIGLTTHQLMSMQRPGGGNTYGMAADAIRNIKGSGPKTARAGRFGSKKGVYTVHSMGPESPLFKARKTKYKTRTGPTGASYKYKPPSRTTKAAWSVLGMS